MIREEGKELSLFDKANAAARAAMGSVVELAARTHTPVIVFQDGKIERLSPSALEQRQLKPRGGSAHGTDTNEF